MIKEIKFKKLTPNAVAPYRANPLDAGADLTAISIEKDVGTGIITYGTGLAVSIPAGYVGFILPRSSIFRKNLSLTNSIGCIDSGYTGEIKFKFRPTDFRAEVYEVGERVGQLVIVPINLCSFVETDDLEFSNRGNGGFGSTGR
jgi:dUTP pyrophosphatase